MIDTLYTLYDRTLLNSFSATTFFFAVSFTFSPIDIQRWTEPTSATSYLTFVGDWERSGSTNDIFTAGMTHVMDAI